MTIRRSRPFSNMVQLMVLILGIHSHVAAAAATTSRRTRSAMLRPERSLGSLEDHFEDPDELDVAPFAAPPPTLAPSEQPSVSSAPSMGPTAIPTTSIPTFAPITNTPTTTSPTLMPTISPTLSPSMTPTTTMIPSSAPQSLVSVRDSGGDNPDNNVTAADNGGGVNVPAAAALALGGTLLILAGLVLQRRAVRQNQNDKRAAGTPKLEQFYEVFDSSDDGGQGSHSSTDSSV